eukprot:Phypoly_transcript_20447.p1 GENE.Phypoly_transcript_20447~~Phypoly_transcript_20447.p1  ORF type:complete len:204 (+),score=35.14 Phypoly_transcript_20447:22-612(+)
MNSSEIDKGELDSVVVDVTRNFAVFEKEYECISNVQRITTDYDKYFQKNQADIKQLIQDIALRVEKAKSATKLPNDNNEATATGLKKNIASTHKSNTAIEDRIEELKRMNEQMSQEALTVAERSSSLLKEANQSLPYDRHTLVLYEKMTNTVWDYTSPNIKGFITLLHSAQPFDWNPSQHSSFETCNSLWEFLGAV